MNELSLASLCHRQWAILMAFDPKVVNSSEYLTAQTTSPLGAPGVEAEGRWLEE